MTIRVCFDTVCWTLACKRFSSSSRCRHNWDPARSTALFRNHLLAVLFSRQNRVRCWQVTGRDLIKRSQINLGLCLPVLWKTMHCSPQSTQTVTRAGCSHQMTERM